MNRSFLSKLLSVLFVVTGCGPSYQVGDRLSVDEQEAFKYLVIRYAGGLPKRATDSTKFEARFDEAYQAQARAMQLDKHYRNKEDGFTYFEISRVAPSLHERFVATGGRLKIDSAGSIIEYEEIYRTWKMPRKDLEKKTSVFFDGMVKGRDLSPYYTVNVGDTEHIEFPDERTYFDKEARKWKVKDQ